MVSLYLSVSLSFFTDTPTAEIYTLSLHDALPISPCPSGRERTRPPNPLGPRADTWSDSGCPCRRTRFTSPGDPRRSEEHTSELQSHVNLVCRLLLEKKKKAPAISPRQWMLACLSA